LWCQLELKKVMSLSAIQLKMIRRLLQSGTESKIAHLVDKIHPSDLTILFSELSPLETQRLIDSLFLVSKAGLTLRELPEFMLPDILELIDENKLVTIISRLEPDDALFLLERIPETRWRVLLESLPQGIRDKLDKLLLYPHDSAGSIMNSNYISVGMDLTAEQAINKLRNYPEITGIFYIYVTDEGNRLVGVQSLRQLVLASPQTKISDIMTKNVHAILASTHKEETSQVVSRYNLLAIPVVNENRELLGVITVDDIIDIVKEEATEDIYHMAGLSEVDRAMTPLSIKVRKRLPWMLLNLMTASLVALVVGYFQDAIHEMVVLAVFMPIVAGLGGNTATQSLTVLARSIALGELTFIKAYKVIFKEMFNGLILGALAGVIMGLIAWIWKDSLILGVVLFLAMILNLLMGGLVGAAVPVLFKHFKLDPALGTSVLVTLFTDGLGFFFFLGLASLMMPYLR
jgi:magnesium transporter